MAADCVASRPTWSGSRPPTPPVDLLALDEALEWLSSDSPMRAELVKLRFFAGLTVPEAAGMHGISVAPAERHWTYARDRLFAELGGGDAPARPAPGPRPSEKSG